ncbi:MAG: hypothetical protein KF849_14565 [Rhizobiaceae bacterium]|nr:hypothetical protein [Rhizobiaceae bacterium]
MRFLWLAAVLAPLCGCANFDADPVPGARREGNYPNLNIRPKSAAAQYSDAEAGSDRAGLSAIKDVVAAEGATPHESQRERLEELGASHGQKAIEEIEGKPAQ